MFLYALSVAAGGKVSRDGHVAVAKACYSVPREYLGRGAWGRHARR
jgi:hypothetical protein